MANNKPLMNVPIGQWIRVTVEAPLGSQASGGYTLTVAAVGAEPQRFSGLAVGNPQWRSLRWLGFISPADAKTTIYLDDVKLETR